MLNKTYKKALAGLLLSLAFAGNALAVEPTSLAEVGTNVSTEIAANQGMMFGIMGAVMTIAVLLMIFNRGKRVAK